MTKALWMTVAVSALALSGCGGGSDYTAPAPAPVPSDPTVAVPPAASESTAGLVSYLSALAAADAEAKEPVSLDDYEPKTNEDTEPDALP